MGAKVQSIHAGASEFRQVGDAIIRKAIRSESSDIQIIPRQDYSLIRFRSDGEFTPAIKVPLAVHEQVLNYFRHLTPRNQHQSAATPTAIQVKVSNHFYDIEVQTSPTDYGDSIMVHMACKQPTVSLDAIGLNKELRQKVHQALLAPKGLILLSGPSGSGKTTALYALINHLVKQGKKVMTIENCVDVELSGVIQVQHAFTAGETYLNDAVLQRIRAEGVDVVMVCHMYDATTAKAMFHLARDGLMVLSSIHANDAAATLSYLMSLGIDKGLLSDVLKIVLNQRLLKQLCHECHEHVYPDADLLARFDLPTDTQVYQASGCSICMNTGYQGHLAVHEAILMSDEIARLIHHKASDLEILQACRKDGMLSLFDDGLNKALTGKLCMNDILRELPKPSQWQAMDDHHRHRITSSTSFYFRQRPEESLPQQSNRTLETSQKSLLLIEDSHTVRDYLSYILRRGGQYDVVDVETAEEGLSILMQQRPSIIVTDQVLPGMNGTSLIATVRSNPKLASIPIILLTSEEKMEIEALRTGADGYISKPVDPELLLARVNAIYSAYQRMKNQPVL